jgi:hypothetical protein
VCELANIASWWQRGNDQLCTTVVDDQPSNIAQFYCRNRREVQAETASVSLECLFKVMGAPILGVHPRAIMNSLAYRAVLVSARCSRGPSISSRALEHQLLLTGMLNLTPGLIGPCRLQRLKRLSSAKFCKIGNVPSASRELPRPDGRQTAVRPHAAALVSTRDVVAYEVAS